MCRAVLWCVISPRAWGRLASVALDGLAYSRGWTRGGPLTLGCSCAVNRTARTPVQCSSRMSAGSFAAAAGIPAGQRVPRPRAPGSVARCSLALHFPPWLSSPVSVHVLFCFSIVSEMLLWAPILARPPAASHRFQRNVPDQEKKKKSPALWCEKPEGCGQSSDSVQNQKTLKPEFKSCLHPS